MCDFNANTHACMPAKVTTFAFNKTAKNKNKKKQIKHHKTYSHHIQLGAWCMNSPPKNAHNDKT